ncbi:MAG: SLC13 family permease [Propylenella sp.]
MTIQQGLAFAVIFGMMGFFVWGRYRYDLVAMAALFVAVVVGIVPADEAFTGYSDDIVIIVGSALLVSAAVARSGIVEQVLRRIGRYITSQRIMIIVLVGAVTLLSAFVKNIGALAMLMPVAFQLARRTNTPPSYLLMPMAFGSLMGGTMTLIGTSPNVIVSQMRENLIGQPFRMFDFTPVGLSIAAIGVAFLAFAFRLLPADRKGAASIDAAFSIRSYTTEVHLPPDSRYVGQTIADLEKIGEGEVQVVTIIRERFRRVTPSPNWVLEAGETLLLEGESSALEQIIEQAQLKLAGSEGENKEDTEPTGTPAPAPATGDDFGVMEAIVMADSPLVERTPVQAQLAERYQIGVLAVSRSGERLTRRLRTIKFQVGDVVVLQGNLSQMPEALGELRCLPLAVRDIRLGQDRRRYVPILVLAAAMALVAAQVVPVAFGFFGAAVVLVVLKSISLREAYDVMDWPLLILIGSLIPISAAMQTTGVTDLIAAWLSVAGSALPPHGALAMILIAGMAVTPFLNNAATVLVMAPIAAQFANGLGYNPDPFLMAVALGAASDFLTPIGHQSNTLVMGPGGYRFGDYWRLGLPLSILVVLVGTPLIALIFPFGAR